MKPRLVMTTIDDIIRLFADYCGREDFPPDVQAVALMLHPTERKVAIVADSADWPQGSAPLTVSFDLRRTFAIGDGR